MTWGAVWRPVAGAVLGIVLLAATGSAQAASAFAGLGGSWSGSGHIKLENGQREAIRCSANYVPRSGNAMGLSLRCASASGRVELRASLEARGSRVSGTWEERSYGVSGDVSGVASGGGNLRLVFGGSLSGAMLVTTSGNSQSISVRTDTTALQGVNVSLRRNN